MLHDAADHALDGPHACSEWQRTAAQAQISECRARQTRLPAVALGAGSGRDGHLLAICAACQKRDVSIAGV